MAGQYIHPSKTHLLITANQIYQIYLDDFAKLVQIFEKYSVTQKFYCADLLFLFLELKKLEKDKICLVPSSSNVKLILVSSLTFESFAKPSPNLPTKS